MTFTTLKQPNLRYNLVGYSASISVLVHALDAIFGGVYVSSKLTPYFSPMGSTKEYHTTIRSICNGLIAHRPKIVFAILDIKKIPELLPVNAFFQHTA